MNPEIRFISNSGSINIAGGINSLLSLTLVSGLALPEKEVTAAVFKNIAGQKIISMRDKVRTIKIEGLSESGVEKAAHILYSPGTLIFKTDRMTRVINARCTHLSDRSSNGKISMSFVCDNPYFHDGTDLKVPVYSRIKLLSSPFTLPCVFTQRVREGNCKNESTVLCEPEILVENKGEAEVTDFTVTNRTTGTSILINTTLAPGDFVKINIKDRTVTSKSGENLLPCLSESSYLHDFTLVPGDNLIKFSAADGLECEITYNTNYTEAVI